MNNLPELTADQREKLAKLEVEMALKRKRDEESKDRKLAASKRTGIPYDIVDIDVVKLGSMLGLFKNKKNRESNQNDNDDVSILNLLLGIGTCIKPQYDYSKIPPYFICTKEKIQEDAKLSYQREYVNMKCTEYSNFVSEFLKTIYERVERVISLSIQHLSINSFIEAVQENSDVVLDIISDTNDPVELSEMHNQLKVLRNSLISIIPICEYKKILTYQVLKLIQMKKYVSMSIGLSYIDATLALYPELDTIEPYDILSIRRSLIVRTYNKDPKLTPLNMSVIAKECCTPCIMYVHLAEILSQSIIGPYANNPVGFLKSASNYYVLKYISDDGIRMWICDDGLHMFSSVLRSPMISYVTKTLKTIESVITNKTASKHPIIVQLEDTLSALNQPELFRKLICSIVFANSIIIPSEADVFDRIPSN